MNIFILPGWFNADGKYLTKDRRHYFEFVITSKGNHYVVKCTKHPSLNGRSSNVHKTHLWGSKCICFSKGRAPKSITEAQRRACEWAEYYSEYVKTGKAMS